MLLRVSLACCFASARSLRQAAVCWAMMFASLLGRSLAVYRCHHSTTGRCVSSSLVLFFRVVFRSTRIAFSTTIILRHQAHTQPQTHDESVDVSPCVHGSWRATHGLLTPAAPAHHCFLGWFATASLDGLQAARARQRRALRAGSETPERCTDTTSSPDARGKRAPAQRTYARGNARNAVFAGSARNGVLPAAQPKPNTGNAPNAGNVPNARQRL